MNDLAYNGVLPLRKPTGMTSHDCVYKIRRLFQTKKVGHTGTLDPNVEGVLPICIGRATKIANYFSENTKTYEGVIELGKATTTEDASGDIIAEKKVLGEINRNVVEEVFQQFVGDISQTPPMYSAVKIKGKKLYEYARAGMTVERPTRTITIYELDLLDNNKAYSNHIRFRVHCSKGTYVRTLAVDVGKKLGYPAHLSYLIRTASGPIKIKDCYTFEQLEALSNKHCLSETLTSISEALTHLPSLVVNEHMEEKVLNGAVFENPPPFYSSEFTVYNNQGECLAIYQPHPRKQGLIKPVKVLKIT